jgi:two-component system, LuxR family, sensor kinase FixL
MILEVHTQEFESAQSMEAKALQENEISPLDRHLEAKHGEALTSSQTRRSLQVYSQTVHPFQGLRSPIDASGAGQDASFSQAIETATLSSLLRSFPEALAVCSSKGVILYLNPAALQLFGYNANEIAGYKFASLLMPVPADEVALSQDYWDSAARDNCLKGRKKSGEIFPVDLSKAELDLRGRKLYIISVRDISSQQRLKQHVAELQSELLHLARFTAMGELASTITHELKQPLAAIITYAAAARQVSMTEGEHSAQANLDLLDKIANQAQRCGDIIRKLRQLVSERSIDRIYADLCTTIQEAVQLASFGAAKHNIQIAVELPPQPVIILMDRSQILMLASNLVRNAIDELATWRHERRIEVALTLPSPDMAQLTVADTGPGILSTSFENIFDPFHTTKPEGSGMGLALSRRIAEAHFGRLAAANRPDGGAIFKFCIPIGKGEKVGE